MGSRDFKNSFYFGIIQVSSIPGTHQKFRLVKWPFRFRYKQCAKIWEAIVPSWLQQPCKAFHAHHRHSGVINPSPTPPNTNQTRYNVSLSDTVIVICLLSSIQAHLVFRCSRATTGGKSAIEVLHPKMEVPLKVSIFQKQIMVSKLLPKTNQTQYPGRLLPQG